MKKKGFTNIQNFAPISSLHQNKGNCQVLAKTIHLKVLVYIVEAGAMAVRQGPLLVLALICIRLTGQSLIVTTGHLTLLRYYCHSTPLRLDNFDRDDHVSVLRLPSKSQENIVV